MCGLFEQAELVIAGVGNRFRSDDGVGLRLAEEWRATGSEVVSVELWEDYDGAAVAQRLVELAKPVVIVDCAEMGLAGGAFRLLDGADVENIPTRSVVSTHGIGLVEGMQLAAALGYVQTLWVFGVQPFEIGMGEELSPAMVAVLPDLRQGLACAVTELLRERVAG